jgi:hypothetical protein
MARRSGLERAPPPMRPFAPNATAARRHADDKAPTARRRATATDEPHARVKIKSMRAPMPHLLTAAWLALCGIMIFADFATGARCAAEIFRALRRTGRTFR